MSRNPLRVSMVFTILMVGATAVLNPAIAKDDSPLPGKEKMTNPSRIASILEKTKPVCFTRFIIDVPASATVVYGRMTADVELERYPGMAHDVDQMMARQIESNCEYAHIFNKGSELDKLAGIPIKSSDDRLKHVIGIKGYDRYSVHSFLTIGVDVYVLRSSGVQSDSVKHVMRRNESIVSSLRTRQDSEIPNEEGVCIDGAFTSQNPTYENIEVGVRLAEFPDVHFSISLMRNVDYAEPQEEFLNRHEAALQDKREAGFGDFVDSLKFLRKSPRTVNGWPGDELIIGFPVWKGTPEAQQFMFWSTGKITDALNPQVDIMLDTGVKDNKTHSVKSSLTDDEALELWDRLINSIRVRPINSRASSEAPAFEVGATLLTGAVCPQSGWWGSNSPAAIEPARWFAKGDRFPQICYREQSTWWGKLFGKQKAMSGNGLWQLQRLDEGSDP